MIWLEAGLGDPATPLAALLSPCILLTHNYKHFRPLGITDPRQGVNAIVAAIDVGVGERQFQAVIAVPTAPVVLVGGETKWAADRIGPLAYVILAALLVGGFVLYRRQDPERRQAIKRVASEVGSFILEESSKAAHSVNYAQQRLGSYVVPGPENRRPPAAVLRALAMASESMSAQQLCEALEEPVRPAVAPLREYLHLNKKSIFGEVRHGSFVLGNRHGIRKADGQ